jgi:hypothetical protein
MSVLCLGCHYRSEDYREHRRHLQAADHVDEGAAFKGSDNPPDW